MKPIVAGLVMLTYCLAKTDAQAFYNPSTGRWLSRDPVGERGGPNLDSFVNNSPVTSVDPVGLIQWQPATFLQGPHPLKTDPRVSVKDYIIYTDLDRLLWTWRPEDGRSYNCHGFAFDGVNAPAGPFSLYGDSVPKVLSDEWVPICCGRAGHKGGEPPSAIAVFFSSELGVTHSGKVAVSSLDGAKFDENRSILMSKWGTSEERPNFRTFAQNVAAYKSRYSCYVKKGDPRLNETTCCPGPGPNETPITRLR